MENVTRRTKILATLGPASEDENVLRNLIKAGLNGVRANFSHGTLDEHQARIDLVRKVAKEEERTISILGDLQGPKIRIAKFKNNAVTLEQGARFTLDANLDQNSGDETQVGIDYKELPNDVKEGDILLLDDGRVIFEVDTVEGTKINCLVTVGGKLSNNKGINKKGGGLSAAALTDKDKADIKMAAKLKVDYVAVSFPRGPEDMLEARELLLAEGSEAGLIAKIERTEAVDCIEEIIKVSEGVMVARGDLAVEIGDEEVPAVQKDMIQSARSLDKIVITATQMMESMITSPAPTRAEVSDVANAVLDGTDVVMLSAETAVGDHPVTVVETMSRICLAAEKHPSTRISKHRLEIQFERVDEAIAMSTMYLANHFPVKAIICLTESGYTPLLMSRIHSHMPIYALTRNAFTQGKAALYRGVEPLSFDSTRMPKHYVNREAVEVLVQKGIVSEEDWVILTSGDHMGLLGGTNKIKVVQVGHVV